MTASRGVKYNETKRVGASAPTLDEPRESMNIPESCKTCLLHEDVEDEDLDLIYCDYWEKTRLGIAYCERYIACGGTLTECAETTLDS